MRPSPLPAALATTALLLGSALAVAATAEVTLYNYEGQTSVVRNRKTLPPDFDMRLKQGDTLRTEPDSYIDVTMNQLAGVRLLGSCVAELTNPNAGSMELHLAQGEALGSVRPLSTGGNFRFRTPIATAETRYAQFYVRLWTDPKGNSIVTFAVRKGTLNVKILSSSTTVAVIDEKALDIPAGAYLPSIRNVTEEETRTLSRTLSVYIADS